MNDTATEHEIETLSTTTIETEEGLNTTVVKRLTMGEFRLTASHSDHGGESWHKVAILSGPFPTPPEFAECEQATERFPGRNCSRRRPCDACYVREDWEGDILQIVANMTGWGLFSHGHNSAHMTGRPFADAAWITPKSGGRVRVSQSGGLDI